jgi:ubiquinone/menaquinone biosynthesis C-methylase UbiE
MNLFRWAAPVYHFIVDPRRSGEDAALIAARLRPFVAPGGLLLDLGGGTGALASRLAGALHARVVILDPSEYMLAYVPRHPSIVPIAGVAESMPFPNRNFDAVLVSDAFHHVRDPVGAATEIARVLKPSGGALILEMDPRGWTRMVAAAERLFGEPGHFFSPPELCALFASRDITGNWRREAGDTYSFLGTLRASEDPLGQPTNGYLRS